MTTWTIDGVPEVVVDNEPAPAVENTWVINGVPVYETLYADTIQYVPQGDDAVERTVQAKLQESVSVKDFGAVGDGVTDDTTAIQNCIDYAAGVCKVYIPGGTYLTSLELKVPSYSYIYGDGPGITIITRLATAAKRQCGFTNSNNTRTDANTGNSYIVIKDLEIAGALETATGSVGSATSGCGIGLAYVTNALIENVYSHNWSKHCFDVSAKYYWTESNHHPTEYVDGPSSNVTLRNCSATQSGDDLMTTHFSGGIFIENPNLWGSESTVGINLNRNGIEIDDGSYDVVVVGGLIRTCNSGIEIKAHSYAPAATRIRVYGVTIRDCARCINLRHLGFYGPSYGDEYSATAKDVLISGCVLYSPQGYASGGLLPRALRIASYDNVRVEGVTVIQSDNSLGDPPDPEDEDTSAPIYIHLGAQNVVIDSLSVRNYDAAEEAIIRITSSSRGKISIKNTVFENCPGNRTVSPDGVPCIYMAAGVDGILIDNLCATYDVPLGGSNIKYAVNLDFSPELNNCYVKNVSTTGYDYAARLGGVGAQFNDNMDSSLIQNWVVADTTGGTTGFPQECITMGWSEGSQNLGPGEGVKLNFKFKLYDSTTIYEGAYISSYKVIDDDASTSTALRFATRLNTDAGTDATARWEISREGNFSPLANTYTFGNSTQYVSEAWIGGTRWLSGSGSPESVITAPVGSIYTRTDGGAGTTLYVKESGTGNTGWVAK